jgi:hypothetical protein
MIWRQEQAQHGEVQLSKKRQHEQRAAQLTHGGRDGGPLQRLRAVARRVAAQHSQHLVCRLRPDGLSAFLAHCHEPLANSTNTSKESGEAAKEFGVDEAPE